jgi:hypothetical protein
MPKFSKKVMGKEIGDAAVYAPPHTMNGKPLRTERMIDPNMITANQERAGKGAAKRVSGGDPANTDINIHGKMEMRGAGAATKGRMSSGKMG